MFYAVRKMFLSKGRWKRNYLCGIKKNALVQKSMENCSWPLLVSPHLQENSRAEIFLVKWKNPPHIHSFSDPPKVDGFFCPHPQIDCLLFLFASQPQALVPAPQPLPPISGPLPAGQLAAGGRKNNFINHDWIQLPLVT